MLCAESGQGVENSLEGFRDWVQVKTVSIDAS
jgi:hypothetical protein